MSLRPSAVALTAIALLAVPAPASAAKHAKPAVREFTGTVASVTAKGKSFRLRRTGRAALVVKVSRKTRFATGAKPRKGRKLVVRARHSRKGWQARSVKLVPVVSGEDEDLSVDDPLGEETDGDEGEELELDLEDPLGDLLGDDDSDEEPEE